MGHILRLFLIVLFNKFEPIIVIGLCQDYMCNWVGVGLQAQLLMVPYLSLNEKLVSPLIGLNVLESPMGS